MATNVRPPEKPRTRLRELKLVFPKDNEQTEEVELIPSEEGKRLKCQGRRCTRETRFYTQKKGVPYPGCLDCLVRLPTEGPKLRIGDIMKRNGYLTQEQIATIIQTQQGEKSSRKFAQIAIHLGYVPEDNAMMCLSELYRFKYLPITDGSIPDPETLSIVSPAVCKEFGLACIGKKGVALFIVAMTDPLNEDALWVLSQGLDRAVVRIMPYLVTQKGMDKILENYAPEKKGGMPFNIRPPGPAVRELLEADIVTDSPSAFDESIQVIEDVPETDMYSQATIPEKLLEKAYKKMFAEAFRRGASDIHVDPLDLHRYWMSFRIDGTLHVPRTIPRGYGLGIVRLVKKDAKIDMGDKLEKVYEGSYTVEYKPWNQNFRVRVVCLPTFIGSACLPKINLRILDSVRSVLSLDELGFDEKTRDLIIRTIRQPDGLVLVAGQTGMGKSTTLAAVAKMKANDPVHRWMIYSIEDPIEYDLPGVNQIEVETDPRLKGERDHSTLLRALARSDPNICLVGEIRDSDTAASAINLAVAGNLVCATVHAADSPGVITRLTRFGLEKFLIGEYTRLIVSQRLVRRLCDCSTQEEVGAQFIRTAGFYYPDQEPLLIRRPKHEGCTNCTAGYKGRMVISEAMLITPRIRELIIMGAPQKVIQREAILQGMLTLRQSGFELIKKGITSIDEVQRLTGDFPDPTIAAREWKGQKQSLLQRSLIHGK